MRGTGILRIAGVPGAFEGGIDVDGEIVTADAELVTITGPSYEPRVIRRPRTVRSWHVSRIASVEWTDRRAA